MTTVRSQEAICKIELDRILRLETKASSVPVSFNGIVLNEDLLLVIDHKVCTLQIYNRHDGKLISSSDRLEFFPTGVCIVSKTIVAVCLWGGKVEIMSLNSNYDVKRVKTLNVRAAFNFCHSIATWNSEKLVVSGRKDEEDMLCWCVLSITDERLESTHDIRQVEGFGMTHLAIKHNLLYISCLTDDSTANCVFAFDICNPKIPKFLYKHQDLKPGPIVADRDYVYVCDYSSNSIHQLTNIGELVEKHIVGTCFHRIFYDDELGVIYAASQESNEIRLYKMKHSYQGGIPVEILNMDERSIELFKDALKDGKETIYNIRIMVVGHMGAGKTTLVKRLLGEEVNISKRWSTEGIDVSVSCCDASLLTKEWIKPEKYSEQDYTLRRLVMLLNKNYQPGVMLVEQDSITSQQTKTDQVPTDIDADHNINTKILYQGSQQNIGQNISSTPSHQKEPTATDVLSNQSQLQKDTMTGRKDPLTLLLKLLKDHQHKSIKDVEKYARLSIWDFAGQYAFYTTHQMFLSRRAIYLMVLDASIELNAVVEDDCYLDIKGKVKCKVHELVEIWINSIHSCALSFTNQLNSSYSSTKSQAVIPPPVIFVGTHIDQIQQPVIEYNKQFEQSDIMKASTVASNTSESTHSSEQLLTSIDLERLQASVERQPRKRRATKPHVPNLSQKGVPCPNPKLLYPVLYHSTDGTFTDRSVLERNCQNVGLQFYGETPGNGNCFFAAVSSQLQRLSYPAQRSPQQLRQDAVAFLKANRVLQVPGGKINFAEFLYNESFEQYCERMEKDGEWADHVMVVAMARTLQTDMMIVTSSPSSGNNDNIAWVVGKENFQEDPILLGHIWEQHYESLEPTDPGLKVKHQRHSVEWMNIDGSNIQEQQRECGQRYLKDIRSYLRGKPAMVHLVDDDFAIDNSVIDRKLEELKKKILEVASQQQYWGEEIPTRWFLLEQQLMSLRDYAVKVISRRAVEQMNLEGSVRIKNSEELDLFLKYLHETGTIIYFSIEVLRDNIILDPKWLIDAMKTLINARPHLPESTCEHRSQSSSSTDIGTQLNVLSDNNGSNNCHPNISTDIATKWSDFKEKGILTIQLVDAIWTENKHPELHANKDHLLRIMEQLNIIAKPRTFDETGKKVENYYLVPCMLREESPIEVISLVPNSQVVSTTDLCFVFKGEYLPPPIFHRLIAACITCWPVAKKKGTSENLIFCGCCVLDIDLFHRLTLQFRKHTIYARITRMVLDEVRTLDARLCSRVRKFVTDSLSFIISYLNQNLQYDLCRQYPKSQCVSEMHSLPPVFDMWFAEAEQDSDVHITHEHMNHARLCIALDTVCVKVMRDILRTQVPAQYTDINQAILASRGVLTTQQGRRKPLLNPDQIQLVFPSTLGHNIGDLEQLDLSLLYTLIRNVSSVKVPSTGWGKYPEDYPQRDTSLGASVERIRSYRNRISGHSPDGKISPQEFKDYWKMFEDVLHDIETVIGKQAYSQKLEMQKQHVFSIYETF